MINYDHSESSRRFYKTYTISFLLIVSCLMSQCLHYTIRAQAMYVCSDGHNIYSLAKLQFFHRIDMYYEVLHLMVWKYLQPNCRWGCLMEANLCAHCKRQTRFPLHGCVAADGSNLCCNYYVLPLLTVLYTVFHALLVLRNSPFRCCEEKLCMS